MKMAGDPQLNEGVKGEIPGGLGEQASADEHEKRGRDDQEDAEVEAGGGTIDKESDDQTGDEADNGCQRDRGSLLAERDLQQLSSALMAGRGAAGTYTTDEDNGFETFTENGDKGQEEQDVLARPAVLAAILGTEHVPEPGKPAGLLLSGDRQVCLFFEGSGDLDPPFDPRPVHPEHSKSHDEDHDHGNHAEDAL